MKVGVPTEIKADEYRVALTPSGVRELADRGHEVVVQAGAGEGSAITDADYEAQGARDPPRRRRGLRRGRADRQGQGAPARRGRAARAAPHALHLPAPRAGPRAHAGPDRVGRDLHRLRDRRGRARPAAAARADERGRGQDRHAGRRVHAREAARRPRRCCSAACPASPRGKVMVIGGGVVGMNAAFIAIGMEAEVYVYDRNIDRLRELDLLLRRPRVDVLRLDARDRAAPAGDGPRDRRGARPRREGAARHHAASSSG